MLPWHSFEEIWAEPFDIPISPWFPDEATLFKILWGDDYEIDCIVSKGSNFHSLGPVRYETVPEGGILISVSQFVYNFNLRIRAIIDISPQAPGGIIPGHCRLCVSKLDWPAQILRMYIANRISQDKPFTSNHVFEVFQNRNKAH